ncbi:MAG: bifunctional phosphoglucose/phosphomannose isomerase [Thermoleophilia bacterium]|nr:bifunctional phosphoglucose/phosphomannose isomerase [Thermoleophilia bacterium]
MLDDAGTYERDPQGLIAGLGRSVEDFDRARAAGEALEIPFPGDAVRDVVVCGMGGSAIAGDLIAAGYADRLRRPVQVVRGYTLPGWVGQDTLCLLLSYSGETEETLTCTMDAMDRGALAVGMSSGGKMTGWYAPRGLPVVPVPAGLQPRMALLHLLIPSVVVLGRLGVLPPQEDELAAARGQLAAAVAAYGPGIPTSENPAKQIAIMLHEGLPLIYGAEATAAVALRWKSQINENAKAPAWWGELPEFDHNEIVGFEGMGRLSEIAHVVLLRDPRHHRQVERRFDLTRELIEERVRGVVGVEAEGEGILARMLDLVVLGDHVSLYMALLKGVDPAPVEMIQRLKDRLAVAAYGRTAGG